MFFRKNKEPQSGGPSDPSDYTVSGELTATRKAFLDDTYLIEAYIDPPEVKQLLHTTADKLRTAFPDFVCLTNVGGTANGSYELRRLEIHKASTDLDIYLVGYAGGLTYLRDMSHMVSQEAKKIGIAVDGELGGDNPENFLNLDDLNGHIDRGELNLLALPFQSAFGDVEVAKKRVVEVVMAHPQKQKVWDEIAMYHAQSLSMHHGDWSPAFNDIILQQYYPEKVARFELPITPEEAVAAL